MNSVVEHKQLQRSGCAIHYIVSGQIGNPPIGLALPASADQRMTQISNQTLILWR